MTRRNKILITLGVIVAVLVGVRIALPSIVTRAINRELQALEAYRGHVQDVDLALWRGAYRMKDIEIVKKDGAREIPFLTSPRLDFSMQWRALLNGSIASELVLFSPEANLVQAENEERSQLGTEEDWPTRLRRVFPFKFNSIQVKEGTVTFTAPGIRSRDAIKLEHVNGWVTNLTNVAQSDAESFAAFKVEGRLLGDAPLRVNGTMNPLAERPTFEVNLEMEGVKLPRINPWLRQYVKADAESGDFQLYLEIAAADGKFEGYAKPLMQHVDLYRADEESEGPLQRAWEGLLDFATDVLENEEKDQLGARIPLRGELHNPDAGVFESIVSVLRNGFIQAFAQSLEGSISLRHVKRDLREIEATSGGGEAKKAKNGKRQTAVRRRIGILAACRDPASRLIRKSAGRLLG